MAGNIGQLLAIQELKNRGVGIAENIASVGSSWAIEPFAGLTGLVALPLGHERATQAINNFRSKAYQPRSKEGKETQEFIADKSKYLSYPAAGYLGMAELATGQGLDRATQTISQATEEGVESAIGDRAYEITGSPLAASVSSAAPAAVASYFGFKGAPKIGKQYQFGDIKSGGNKQRGTFGGVKAKNANLEMQAAAEELANRGIPPEEIWSQTGWFKGQDGKWRFEIDDSGSMPISQKAMSWGESEDWKAGSPVVLRRQKALAHPKLSAAYPDTKNIGVIMRQNSDSGSYNPEYDNITVGGSENGAANRSVMLHELQHSLQKREGFAAGGSPFDKSLPKDVDIAQNINDKFSAQEAQIKDSIEYKSFIDDYVKNTKPEDYPIGRDGNPSKKFLVQKAEREAYEKFGLDALDNERLKEVDRILKSGDQFGQKHAAYKRLYGEAESRLVEERMNMTEAERKAYPPMKHMEDMLAKEGIKMDELIVRGDSGKSMSIEQQMAREELSKRGITAYHGTGANIKKFRMSKVGSGIGGDEPFDRSGLYFTDSKKYAEDIKNVAEESGDRKGSIYKVNLDIDPEKEMLDDNVPLKNHPNYENIKAMLNKEVGETDWLGNDWGELTGSRIVSELYNTTYDMKKVRKLLGKVGIKGAKYKNESPTVGKKGDLNYVIFDEKIIDIAEKNNKSMSIEQQMAREELKRRGVNPQTNLVKNEIKPQYRDRAESIKGWSEYYGRREWGSPEEAKKDLARAIKRNNENLPFGKPTDPSIVDDFKIVKRGNKYGISQSGISKNKKPELEIMDEPSSGSPEGNFRAKDLQDTGKGIMVDYGRGKGVVKSGYISIDLLPKAKLAGGKNAYDWSELESGGQIPPIKIRKNKNGSITILDGNHRIEFFRDMGYDTIPAYVIDESVK